MIKYIYYGMSRSIIRGKREKEVNFLSSVRFQTFCLVPRHPSNILVNSKTALICTDVLISDTFLLIQPATQKKTLE